METERGTARHVVSDTPPPGSDLRAVSGEAYTPAGCRAGGETFTDVPSTDPFCKWIEQAARDGINPGCDPANDRFCPDNPVTRRLAAAMFERAMRGTATWSPLQGSTVAPPPAGPDLATIEFAVGVGFTTSIAIGADGLPVIAYYGGGGAPWKVVHCNDLACAGGDEAPTTPDGPGSSSYPSITMGADGLPIASYLDETSDDLKVAHCSDLACSAVTATTVDATGFVGAFTSITIGSDGLPIISYYDFTNTALKVAHCNDLLCAGGDESKTTVEATGDVGRYTSIAIGADGLPIISYNDSTNDDLKVAHCNDLLCAGGNETRTTVDPSAGDVGRNTSIAIGVDGLPIISYYDLTNGDLKVAHCNDRLCAGSDETLTAVDTAGVVGLYTSITIGADGLPIVSYRDATNSNLKVAHCNDVSCAGGDEALTTVDATGDAGYQTSITIGADGLPIISYFDSSGLKVAHCANALCLPFSRGHGDPGVR
jgi:predicted regulator of Ras-like GTPase activity (Roadblock/LC7/MglB family)